MPSTMYYFRAKPTEAISKPHIVLSNKNKESHHIKQVGYPSNKGVDYPAVLM